MPSVNVFLCGSSVLLPRQRCSGEAWTVLAHPAVGSFYSLFSLLGSPRHATTACLTIFGQVAGEENIFANLFWHQLAAHCFFPATLFLFYSFLSPFFSCFQLLCWRTLALFSSSNMLMRLRFLRSDVDFFRLLNRARLWRAQESQNPQNDTRLRSAACVLIFKLLLSVLRCAWAWFWRTNNAHTTRTPLTRTTFVSLSLLPPTPPRTSGKGRRGVEIRAEQTLDQLFRGGRNVPAAVQHHPNPEEHLLPLPLVLQEVLRPNEGGEEGAHEDHTGRWREVVEFGLDWF